MADILSPNLPSELRALVDFLHADRRPTAIFNDYNVVRKEQLSSSALYKNSAFDNLGLREHDVEHLLKECVSSALRPEKRSHSRLALGEGLTWELKSIAQRWKVLVGNDILRSSNTGDAGHASNAKRHANGSGTRLSPTESGPQSPNTPAHAQDWTRVDLDVPGLSSWIQQLRIFDWSTTGLGSMHAWPERLRGYVMHVMRNPSPRLILWGDVRTLIYNEACIPLFGDKHPHCLGQRASEIWAEIWSDFGPLVEDAFIGNVSKLERMPLTMTRNGFLEDTFWDFTFLPVTGADNIVTGMFLELLDTTLQVVGERRRTAIMDLSEHISTSNDLSELWSHYMRGLKSSLEDIPFALLYAVVDDASESNAQDATSEDRASATKKCVLEGSMGVPEHLPGILKEFSLAESSDFGEDIITPCRNVWKSHQSTKLSLEDGSLPQYLSKAITDRAFDTVESAMVSPITSLGGNDVLAIVVYGWNPRCPLDEQFTIFTKFLSEILERRGSLIALPEEQRKAQKISDDMNTALAQQLRMITLQAERKEAKFARMAAEAPTGMFVCDPEGRLLYANDAYFNVLGEPNDTNTARNRNEIAWGTHIHPEDLARFTKGWERVLEQKAPLTIEHRLKKPWSESPESPQEISGETWLLANAFPDVDEHGKTIAVQGWLTDISHRKFTERLLSQKLEDALENKRQTENFIDMTSHEMRNPLSAILQSADSVVSTLRPADSLELQPITLTTDIVDEIVDAAETIILCAQHQKRIVDDILTLSKLDSSLLVLAPDKVQPPTLLHKALKMFEAELTRADIKAKVNIEPTYEQLGVDWVVLDPSRLLQVIINLLTNAIKFTQHSERREITMLLGASFDPPSGKHHGVDFIPTKYSRPSDSPLAEWGDGEFIYLQVAVIDTGSGLSPDDMKVLFQRFSQASPRTYKQYGGSGLGLFISRELCELQGGRIGVSSENGKTKFTFFVRAKKYMPEAIKDDHRRPSLPRWTSASASPMVFNRRGSSVLDDSKAGAKETSTTVASVTEADENSTTSKTSNGHAKVISKKPQNDGEKLAVCLVEDNKINQKVMSKQLKAAGCTVHVANHGLECLEFLEKTTFCSGDIPLSVVLLDLEMPTMDGLTCIRLIREKQTKGEIKGHIPVIAVTANARSEQISIAIDAGMDSVVTKPFRIPELVPQMHTLVADVARRESLG